MWVAIHFFQLSLSLSLYTGYFTYRLFQVISGRSNLKEPYSWLRLNNGHVTSLVVYSDLIIFVNSSEGMLEPLFSIYFDLHWLHIYTFLGNQW